MADPTPAPRIQFGEEIHPVKSAGVYSAMVKDAALLEKNGGLDLEQRALQIADSDLNRKKKQVMFSDFAIIYRSFVSHTASFSSWDGIFLVRDS